MRDLRRFVPSIEEVNMKRIIVALVALAAAGVVGSASGGSGKPPLTPAQVQYDSSHGFASSTPVVTQVTPQQALQAGHEPGAVTEGAVPSNPKNATVSGAAVAAAGAYMCWSTTGLWSEWGIYPIQERVTEYRYWCGYIGGAQTYRTSSAHLGSTICSNDSPYDTRISGGNGYSWTVVRTGGNFTCPTGVPWLNYHYQRWQDWSANTWGNVALVAHS